jgi:hypothetical protein
LRAGEHCGFVKAWKKMEEKVGGSKGLVALSLNKPAGEAVCCTALGTCMANLVLQSASFALIKNSTGIFTLPTSHKAEGHVLWYHISPDL